MKRILFIDRDGTIIKEPEDEQIDAFENLLVIKDHNDILELNNYAFFQISTSVKKRK